ncbi:MAG: protein-arginine deiminase family protein, partial [Planctomycetota bacterium]
ALAGDVLDMLKEDVGYFTAFDYPPVSSTLDIGGNLEVTPPTDEHPFGRVYYGSDESTDTRFTYIKREINEGFQRFFERQELQSPINLTTDWLIVGHVDELVTFVPQPDGGMKMLISSPALALKILRAEDASHPLNSRYRDAYGLLTVGQMLSRKYPALGLNAVELNMAVDEKLFGLDHSSPSDGSVKKIFMDALGLEESDIIEVPVFYQNFDFKAAQFSVIAQTPALVNLHCMERDMLVPRPFIPSIAADFEEAMKETNMKIHWIDDWQIYHVADGEIHCGSNSRRGFFDKKWWNN